jgi:hypothetical protein
MEEPKLLKAGRARTVVEVEKGGGIRGVQHGGGIPGVQGRREGVAGGYPV